MSVIKLPELAWYGAKERELELPERWQVKAYPFAGAGQPKMTPEAVRRAIASPTGTTPMDCTPG